VSLNWVEIDTILKELPLEGCHLQGVRQADYHTYFLEFYRPGRPLTLGIFLAPRQTRLHEVRQRPATLKRAPRFTEFLKARLLGSVIVEARQLGQERLVLLRLRLGTEEFSLWIRLWGGAANILVTDHQHQILDAAFRRPASGEVFGRTFDPVSQFSESSDLTSGGKSRSEGKVFTARTFDAERQQEPQASFNRLVELQYRSIPPIEAEKLREQALRLVERRLSAVAQAHDKSQARLQEFERRDDWKLYGDVLTSDSWKIHKGDTSFEGVDWRDNANFRLPLDAKLLPHEHAQVWYKKYQKARDGEQGVREELASQEAEQARWQLALEQLPSWEAPAVAAFLEKHRVVKTTQVKPGQDQRPGLEFVSGPWTLWVGRNARENDTLLRRWVRGNDLWLHTRDVPGGFVFVRFLKGKTVPLEVLLDAGNLAIWYSKAKGDGRADLYYTAVKYLRRAQNGPAGLVLPTQEKNLTVTVDKLRMERLLRGKEETA